MRILIIDGDKKICSFLECGLKQAGYAADSSKRIKEGFYFAAINDYDLIISEIIFENNNDNDLENIIKSLKKEKKSCSVMILSKEKSVESKVRYLEAGADDYMAKPFDLSELLARVRAIVRRPYGVKGSIGKIKDYEIDFNKRTLSKNNKEIKVSKKEFSLLEFFVFNKNIVLSRAHIMEHVWDINADPFSNTIETHIRSLRIKLKDQKSKKLIVSVPGVGYKLCCE